MAQLPDMTTLLSEVEISLGQPKHTLFVTDELLVAVLGVGYDSRQKTRWVDLGAMG